MIAAYEATGQQHVFLTTKTAKVVTHYWKAKVAGSAWDKETLPVP